MGKLEPFVKPKEIKVIIKQLLNGTVFEKIHMLRTGKAQLERFVTVPAVLFIEFLTTKTEYVKL